MGSTGKLASLVGVGLLAALTLTGCINQGSGFAALDREAEPSDAMPAGLPDYADDDLDPMSSRFVGEHNGNALYLAKGKGGGGRICLLIYPDDSASWVIGCGGALEFRVGGPTGDYTVRPDGAPAPEHSIEVATNVFAPE